MGGKREKGATDARPDPVVGMVRPEALASGHALSLDNQPYLKRLLGLIRDKSHPVTLVLGAGVSIDSGLPTWNLLLDFMIAQIPDGRMRDLAEADRTADPTRQAEYIQRLVAKQTNKSTEEIVRDALYLDNQDPTPGGLANALARLVGSSAERFTVLTTNFDHIFEAALKDNTEIEVQSLGLADAEPADANIACTDELLSVTHLHGMLQRNNDKNLQPIILTEAEFLREGPRVRGIIGRQLATSTVIFVGLSLTDPNLVGPLWEFAHAGDSTGRKYEHFVLTVVPDSEIGSFLDICQYEISKAAHLDENLSLRPVFMKSYSQLIQMVNDMGLAAVETVRYSKNPSCGTSIRYGKRLQECLRNAYGHIGCVRSESIPVAAAAEVLSERLHNALTVRSGPIDALKNLRSQLIEAGVEDLPQLNEEHFGLTLWLRVPGHGSKRPPYAIQLVGTSICAHREAWSIQRSEEINRRSEFIASKCLYWGRTEVGDVRAADPPSLWKGVLATPITIYAIGSGASLTGTYETMLDRVTIGVATLNTTAGMDVAQPQRSLISWAHEIGELAAIAKAVEAAVVPIVNPKANR
jgi:hypothetical protein